VETETTTNLAPWEIEEETEAERQDRYAREADEMKLKWDARRLEERQSAQRRQAYSQKEQERACLYGPRDLPMEAYEARMYEEARVIEVRRRQREVYERIKASKEGKPLPPKGEPYVQLRPPVAQPLPPEEFDTSGHYDPTEDIEAKKYKAPKSYVSPTGPAPPPREKRGAPRAAWEDEPYDPPRGSSSSADDWPEPGSLPADTVPSVRAYIEAHRAEHAAKPRRFPVPDETEKTLPSKPASKPAAKATPAAVEAPVQKESKLPYTKEDIEGMTVPQLKEALRNADMPITGKKADLLERLLAAI